MTEIFDKERKTITWELEEVGKIVCYGEYSESADITFIMEDCFNKEGKCISTEVVGFYYGVPEIEYIKENRGKRKAEF